MYEKKGLDVVNIRLVKEKTLYSNQKIQSPEHCIEVIAEEIRQYDREVIIALNLQTDGRPINFSICHLGTINSAQVRPADVFKSAILSNAAKMILFHNHPSGTPTPSREDELVTERIKDCGELLDIPLLDHIVVGEEDTYFSFREHRLLSAPGESSLEKEYSAMEGRRMSARSR